jgi:hypothetical protein
MIMITPLTHVWHQHTTYGIFIGKARTPINGTKVVIKGVPASFVYSQAHGFRQYGK